MTLSEFDKQELISLLSTKSFRRCVNAALLRLEAVAPSKTIEESAMSYHYLRGARDLVNQMDILIGKEKDETAIQPRRLNR
jgi:hypothetical protein